MSLVAYASSDDNSESEEEVVLQKKRQPVKITIPSLKEFEEEEKEESTTKKLKPKGGVGLFSILPPPKHCTVSSEPGFTPYILSKKKETKPVKTPITKNIKPSLGFDPTIETDDPFLDTPTDSTEKQDFFSLGTNKSSDNTSSYDTSHISNEISKSLFSDKIQPIGSTNSSLLQYDPEESSENHISVITDSEVSSTTYPSYSPDCSVLQDSVSCAGDLDSSCSSTSDASSPSDYLKDERFLKLKRKTDPKDIDIIDVKASDQLTGKDQWLMQSLTEEKTHRPFKRRHDFPTQQQKRKHQITYLAYQAKEREMDLKNQWALNSLTRRETQAKYGF